MKKGVLSDIIANVDRETTLEEVKEWWEDESGESVSEALVREAAESLARDGRVVLENDKIKPVQKS